jgi:hypothetical protein
MTCVANGFRARLAKISGRILNVDELITVLEQEERQQQQQRQDT